mgnify:CR=1 FL=1|jgi:hypothetical protein
MELNNQIQFVFLILTHQIDWFSGVQDTWDDDVSLAQILCFFF